MNKFPQILGDFIKLSESMECKNCGKTTKLIGETRINGSWFCPYCSAFYTYKDNPDIKVSVPFTKLTTQLEGNTPLGGPLGDPPTENFPLVISTGFLVPSFSYKIEHKMDGLLTQTEDKTRTGRIKSGSYWSFALVFQGRPQLEYDTLVNFWDDMWLINPFNYTDPERGSTHIVFFDSIVSEAEVLSFDELNFSVRISE